MNNDIYDMRWAWADLFNATIEMQYAVGQRKDLGAPIQFGPMSVVRPEQRPRGLVD